MRRCDECGGAVHVERNAVRRYDLGGLPHVELHGVEAVRCRSCGLEELGIPKVAQLHRVLAAYFVNQSRALAAVEVRFLRKHIGLSAADFAKCMGVSRETISRWETGKKPLGAQADRLVRLLVASSTPIADYAAKDALAGLDSSRAVPKRLARVAMRASTDGWRPDREIAAA
ncbi:MAG: type II TA system antitoxin MqsA family protein [Gemmatimonadaceae bacterium]